MQIVSSKLWDLRFSCHLDYFFFLCSREYFKLKAWLKESREGQVFHCLSSCSVISPADLISWYRIQNTRVYRTAECGFFGVL